MRRRWRWGVGNACACVPPSTRARGTAPRPRSGAELLSRGHPRARGTPHSACPPTRRPGTGPNENPLAPRERSERAVRPVGRRRSLLVARRSWSSARGVGLLAPGVAPAPRPSHRGRARLWPRDFAAVTPRPRRGDRGESYRLQWRVRIGLAPISLARAAIMRREHPAASRDAVVGPIVPAGRGGRQAVSPHPGAARDPARAGGPCQR